ncbi:MAG: bifunctional 5,10-methylenetetrahydrofolate dehydrogenase/5,10-methenyltetrahydrofolate cyclohydrolase [Candidatus Beckwithbacteria bacterium]
MTLIIDGVKLALAKEAQLKEAKGLKLKILVYADDQAGRLYSRLKQEAGKRLGIEVETSYEDKLEDWSQDPAVQGIMVQRPGLAWAKKKGMTENEFESWWQVLINKIDRKKDVDGLRDDSPFIQATVRAVEEILQSIKYDTSQGKTVIVGKGMVGKKLSQRLSALNISSRSKDLGATTKIADLLVSVCGREKIIREEMVKDGAVVIDVGWPKGEVDFETVKLKTKAITPVPGGVGPVSVICLLENLIKAGYTS